MQSFDNARVLATGWHISSQTPIDDRLVMLNYTDILSLGPNDEDAYRYYDGLKIFVVENESEYVWKESTTGVLPQSFTYPNNVSLNGVNYSNRSFNLVQSSFPPSITDINVFTTSPLANANYVNVNSISPYFPARKATITSNNTSAFPTLQGVAPYLGIKVLVKDQVNKAQNGDYLLTKLGNGTTEGWELTRISYRKDGFYPRFWMIKDGPEAHKIFTQFNAELNTATIGVTGDIVFGLINQNLDTITVTHIELISLISSSGLIPQASYTITDFQTIYDQPDYGVNKQPKTPVVKTGPVRPIAVVASSVNTLNLEAYDLTYPKDTIKYIPQFTTPVSNTATKGRIIERIDEWGNRTDFDHRTVLFKRYAHLPDDLYSNDVIYCNYWDSSQDYPGREYNIITNTPNLSNSVYPPTGYYFTLICSVIGTRDFGAGPITVQIGDVIAYNGSQWVKLNGTAEYPMFNFNYFEKPENNYIEGTYSANLANSDATYDVEPIFNLPNIVFLESLSYGNKFLGACTNSTFCGETSSNTFFGPTTRLTMGFKQRNPCIGNTVQYRCRDLKVSEAFTLNKIQTIIDVNIRGSFRTNTITYVYGINGIMDIEENIIGDFSDIISSFNQNSNLEIRRNNIVYFSDIIFSNSGKYSEITSVTANTIQLNNFHENAGLFNCNFNWFSGNTVYQDLMSYCKGGFIVQNLFYGTCGYSDFGPRFIYNEVGAGFGLELVAQQYLGDLQNQVSVYGYSNVFKSEIYDCTIGSNFSGNTVDCSLNIVTFPDFFQRNHIKAIGNISNQPLNLSGIPELINPITTTIDGSSVKLTQQIFDANFASLTYNPFIFQDTDVNGEDRYWIRAFSFQFIEAPFMNKSTTFASATLTSIGSGYANSAKIGKVDLYSKKGAISQTLYHGRDNSNICVPSLDELLLMYANRVTLGIGGTDIYWSSSEINATTAYAVDFSTGNTLTLLKTEQHNVSAIKYISHYDAVVLTYFDEYGAKIVKSLFN
jgi:hypothetical protein